MQKKFLEKSFSFLVSVHGPLQDYIASGHFYSHQDLLLSQSKDVSRVKYDVEADEDEATFNLMSPFSPSLAY